MQNDDKVLAFMFDPFLLETLENETEAKLNEENVKLSDKQVRSKALELEAIKSANEQKYEEALGEFDEALMLWPERASIYNNRAQTYRLLNRIEGKHVLFLITDKPAPWACFSV